MLRCDPEAGDARDFEVKLGGGATELICELRGVKAEVWFEVDSLRLVRKTAQ